MISVFGRRLPHFAWHVGLYRQTVATQPNLAAPFTTTVARAHRKYCHHRRRRRARGPGDGDDVLVLREKAKRAGLNWHQLGPKTDSPFRLFWAWFPASLLGLSGGHLARALGSSISLVFPKHFEVHGSILRCVFWPRTRVRTLTPFFSVDERCVAWWWISPAASISWRSWQALCTNDSPKYLGRRPKAKDVMEGRAVWLRFKAEATGWRHPQYDRLASGGVIAVPLLA